MGAADRCGPGFGLSWDRIALNLGAGQEQLSPVAGESPSSFSGPPMQLKLYILLPRPQAERLIERGFEEGPKSYRLSPADYTACSAFSRQALVELQLELSSDEARRYRREVEMPGWDDEATEEQESDERGGEPIYWYEFPADVLNRICRKRSLIEHLSDDCKG
jgi:hypothetical protein